MNSDKVALDEKMVYANGAISNQLATFSIVEVEALLIGDVREGVTLAIADAMINADDSTTDNINGEVPDATDAR